jgi:hypothetical protein
VEFLGRRRTSQLLGKWKVRPESGGLPLPLAGVCGLRIVFVPFMQKKAAAKLQH